MAASRPPRNPRHAYEGGKGITPMSLANMRSLGVTTVQAACEACQHEAVVDVPSQAPSMSRMSRCSSNARRADR
jgi:hypothetical protein